MAAVIELLQMDCMEYLAGCEDNAFELAIVDPPYGILNIGMRITKPSRPNSYTAKLKHANKKWDNAAPTKEYFNSILRVSRNQIICGANYFTDKIPVNGCWIFWDKVNGCGSHFADGEFIWTSFTKASKKFQCSVHHGSRGGIDRVHPTQKPVALYKWLLANYAKDGDRILDTHLGSGSSAIAAHYGGFDFVGTEIDKDYYEATCKRFDQETAQMAMAL